MEELALAYKEISGYYNSSEFAKDLAKDAKKLRETQKKLRAEKRKRAILICVAVISLIVCIVAISIIVSMFNNKTTMYDEAVELYESERYVEAKELFEKLGDYKNSKLYLISIENFINSGTFNGVLVREGNTISLGAYDKDSDEKTSWIVLKVDNETNKAFVISKDILYCSKFNGSEWINSDIRDWINSTFYNDHFTENERARIIKTLYAEYEDDDETKEPLYESMDYITLLSQLEYDKYMTFGSSVSSAEYSDALGTTNSLTGRGAWLMRTVLDTGNIMNITESGAKSIVGYQPDAECGIRPVMWIKLDEKK